MTTASKIPETKIVEIALPTPLRRTFDYLVPTNVDCPQRGNRVLVPFGRRKMIGVVMEQVDESLIAPARLKFVLQVLDSAPAIEEPLLDLLCWASKYYHHPIGEVIFAALPALLRKGRPLVPTQAPLLCLTDLGRTPTKSPRKRATIQNAILDYLRNAPGEQATVSALQKVSANWKSAAAKLVDNGWAKYTAQTPSTNSDQLAPVPGPTLTQEQDWAIRAVAAKLNGFHCFLLHGVTGSGKTEVYLKVVSEVIANGRQAVVLVPEISLTPQLVSRFETRLGTAAAVFHSHLSDSARHRAWYLTKSGQARVILGTRSAVFAPLKNPGVFIVDEEHESAYKQQDGFRYHGRDVAIMQASRLNVPIILGSATPSLESIANANEGRYTLLNLPTRALAASMPKIHLLDLKRLPVQDGLSLPLVYAIADRLEKREQSLLFLNRRGYSPILMCPDCGWLAPCSRCDAKLTYHRIDRKLRCHHCGAEHEALTRCPVCNGEHLYNVGEGTQRLEAALMQRFPDARIVRVDRDTTQQKNALENTLAQIQKGEADILIGTQMLSKGHDFPLVTLVGIINSDQGLYSLDFRATEHLLQQIIQVSGRAGRAERPGEVYIQTMHPESPYFNKIIAHDYSGFAEYALAERKEAGYPPYAYFALLRAESANRNHPLEFLAQSRRRGLQLLKSAALSKVTLMDAIPSPMEKRAGRHRAQLLVSASSRRNLHRFLSEWICEIESLKGKHRVRWSLNVDPMDMY